MSYIILSAVTLGWETDSFSAITIGWDDELFVLAETSPSPPIKISGLGEVLNILT